MAVADTDRVPNIKHTVMAIAAESRELRHVAGPPMRWRAAWTDRSVLGGLPEANAEIRRIAWSGSFAQIDGGEMFDDDPRTWGPKGWGALEERAAGLDGPGVLVRPHARHVVSDVPGCRRLVESDWAKARGIGLCYDPASMCGVGMMARAGDHMRRMYEAIELFEAGAIGMVVVAGLNACAEPCGLEECGELGRIVGELARASVPVDMPLVVLDRGVEGQIGVMERVGM